MGHTFFLCTKWRYCKWGENIVKHLVVDTKHHPRVLRYVLKIEYPVPRRKTSWRAVAYRTGVIFSLVLSERRQAKCAFPLT